MLTHIRVRGIDLDVEFEAKVEKTIEEYFPDLTIISIEVNGEDITELIEGTILLIIRDEILSKIENEDVQRNNSNSRINYGFIPFN